MKKITNVRWAKGDVEKFATYESRSLAFRKAFDPVCWPNEIADYYGMEILITDEKTGEVLRQTTLKKK